MQILIKVGDIAWGSKSQNFSGVICERPQTLYLYACTTKEQYNYEGTTSDKVVSMKLHTHRGGRGGIRADILGSSKGGRVNSILFLRPQCIWGGPKYQNSCVRTLWICPKHSCGAKKVC